MNDAKEGGGPDVCGCNGPVDEASEQGEECGFATTFLGRFDTEIGADVAEFECVSVEHPEGQRFGGAFGEDDEPAHGCGEGIEQNTGVD